MIKTVIMLPKSWRIHVSPHVDDVSLTSSVTVAVKDDVAVASIELSISGRIHRYFVGSLDTPDLSGQKRTG